MKMSTAKTLAQWLCPAGMALLTSCGTIQPRITEVSHRKYVVNIPPEEIGRAHV